MSKTVLFALCLALFAMVATVHANDNPIDTPSADAPELAQFGKFKVGVKTLKLVHAQQLDLVHAQPGQDTPRYDRALTVEVWYPARLATGQAAFGQYRSMTRDGRTVVTLTGSAVRDAAPDPSQGPYPLIIVSHGYPGNRYLLSHLGEKLASQGYVVASIDHTDSTYDDKTAFGSTLLNRSLDQLFVLGEMARLNGQDPGATLQGMVNADQTGLIGYSMGGYGVLNTVGAGVSATSVTFPWGAPNGVLAQRQAGNPAYLASLDPRIRAALVFAPWGWNQGFWDEQALAAIHTPLFFVAGSLDDVSGYAPGVRNLFEASVHAPRYLLTFEGAKHNAGAPIPAPRETWQRVPTLDFIPAEHYADALWDSSRMNHIAQHFATAFMGKYLKHDAAMDAYLKVTEQPQDAQASGRWQGFLPGTAQGLRLEQRQP